MRAYANKLYRSASSVLPTHHQQQPTSAAMEQTNNGFLQPTFPPAAAGEAMPPIQAAYPASNNPIILADGTMLPITNNASGADMLQTFRIHLGIQTLEGGSKHDGKRPAENMGIYPRVVKAEKEAGKSYKLFAFLINGALGLQIIFAAALTALGAGSGSHVAVTAFGALNTVLAGFLTFLKGSGLPNRLKFYENEWAKVREYIEQRERDFTIQKLGVVTLDLGREISTIEQMYEHVRKDIEANTPDSYISLSRHMNNAQNTEPVLAPARQFQGEPVGGIRDHVRNVAPSLARQYTDFAGRAQARFGDLEAAARTRFEGAQHDLEKRFTDTQAGVEHRFQDAQQQVQSRVQGYQSDAEKKYANIQRDFQDRQGQAQTRVHDLESGLQQRYTDTQSAAQQSYQDARSQAQHLQSRLEIERAGLERQYTDTRTNAEQGFTTATDQARNRLTEAEINVQNRILETRYAAEQELRETQKQAESQILLTQSQAEAQIAEQMKQATNKAAEIQEKVLSTAEMVAGKVLEFTSHRHDKDKEKS